ncbi:MAG: SRPBCC domain-containing protein [Chloroflexi bacterium]|nr:SRPBCC domain-containing protein [Chloroflexota bacterium]
MYYVDGVIHIAAPRAVVWRLFADLDRWPRWNPTVVVMAPLRGAPWAPDFRFRQTVRVGGRRLSFKPRVLYTDPGNYVTWVGRGFGVTGVHSWYFEDEATGSRVTTIEEFKGLGVPLMRLVIKPADLRAMFQASLRALKQAAEAEGPG